MSRRPEKVTVGILLRDPGGSFLSGEPTHLLRTDLEIIGRIVKKPATKNLGRHPESMLPMPYGQALQTITSSDL